jgi:thioredoxin-like negative regulator of GroEL
MTPIVNGLADKYEAEFEIVSVDIDSAKGKTLAREHGFIGQPTFMFFDSTGTKVRNLMGPQTEQSLEQAIQSALGR